MSGTLVVLLPSTGNAVVRGEDINEGNIDELPRLEAEDVVELGALVFEGIPKAEVGVDILPSLTPTHW